jgi:DNA-directed RNA polymerase III subunit RPC1
MELVDQELATPRFSSESSPAYLETVRKFILENLANKLAGTRKSRGMFDALEREAEWDEDTDLSMGASGLCLTGLCERQLTKMILDADKAVVDNSSKVTERQLRSFLNLCWVKYVKARIEPGSNHFNRLIIRIVLLNLFQVLLLGLWVHNPSANLGRK